MYGPGIRAAWLFTVSASIADQGLSKQPSQNKRRRFLCDLDWNIILAFAYPCIAAVEILYHHPFLWDSSISVPKLSTYGPLLAGMLTVLSGASFGAGLLVIVYLQDWRRGSSSRLTIVLTAATTTFLVIVSKLCFSVIYGPHTRTPALFFILPTFATIFPETPPLFLSSETCFGHVHIFFDWLDVNDQLHGYSSTWVLMRNFLYATIISAALGLSRTRDDNPSWFKSALRHALTAIKVWIGLICGVHFCKLLLVIAYWVYDPYVMAPITTFPITDRYQMSTMICSGAFVAHGIWSRLRTEAWEDIETGIAFFMIMPLSPLIVICIIGTVIYRLIASLYALISRRRENTSEV